MYMINATMKLIIFTISIFILLTSLLVAKPIYELIIKGNERISSETIKVFSGFNKGDDVNQNDLNDIIKSLYETNFFENVTIEIVNNNLIITVKENPIIQEVVIEGIKKELAQPTPIISMTDLSSNKIENELKLLKETNCNIISLDRLDYSGSYNRINEIINNSR